MTDIVSYIVRDQARPPLLRDEISMETKKSRLLEVQKLLNKNSQTFLDNLINTRQEILIEGVSKRNPDELYGRTDTNKVVNFRAHKDLIGNNVDVQIISAKQNSLQGKIKD